MLYLPIKPTGVPGAQVPHRGVPERDGLQNRYVCVCVYYVCIYTVVGGVCVCVYYVCIYTVVGALSSPYLYPALYPTNLHPTYLYPTYLYQA
jgi:hypothetical protein